MGLASGSVAVTRYRTLGTREASMAELNGWLHPYRAPALDLDRGDAPGEIIGWQAPPALLEEVGGHWDLSDCRVGDDFFLNLTIERRNVPPALLQQLYRKQLWESEAAGQKLGRRARQDLKAALLEELLGRSLPTIKTVDVVWQERAGMVYLYSTGKRERAVFEQLFADTFLKPQEASLVLLDQPLMGGDWWLEEATRSDQLERIRLTEPSPFLKLGIVGEPSATQH